VFQSLLCPAGVCARTSRNKLIPDSVHAPFPALDPQKQRRRAPPCRLSSGAGTDPIDAGSLPYPGCAIIWLRLVRAHTPAGHRVRWRRET